VLRQPDAPVCIRADSRQLYRALENLFSNAAKYALAGTRVFAETETRDDAVYFSLQNTSASPIELTEGDAAAQFMRGDKARHTEGSGLGLYIAKSLIELMGGALHIHIIGDLFRVDIRLPVFM
jgi:signal transduction histidine kinase